MVQVGKIIIFKPQNLTKWQLNNLNWEKNTVTSQLLILEIPILIFRGLIFLKGGFF